MRAAAPLALVAALLPVGAARADWARFYAPSEPAAVVRSGPGLIAPVCDPGLPALSAVPALGETPSGGAGCAPEAFADPPPGPEVLTPVRDGACVLAIRDAEARYGIPKNLLLAIGLQESGLERDEGLTVWPWSVNIEGEGRFLRDSSEAIGLVRERLAAGAELVDVGCMQVNLRWHPDAFASLEEAFDPVRNVDYAARYLAGLVEREGGWRAAAGRYHSADPDRAARYLKGVEANLQVARTAFSRMGDGAAPPVEGAQADPVGVAFSGDLDAYLDALVADPEGGARRPLWSAGLGAGPEGAPVYGLYGGAGLRPVLPAFQRNF